MIASTLTSFELVLCVVFIAYVTAILIPFLRRRDGEQGDPADFEWHTIIPCLNEEAVIGTTLERVRADHPTMHIWCIDDDSDDRTADIVAAAAAEDARIHLIRRVRPAAREGKGEALNTAWRSIRQLVEASGVDPERVIVCVLDADARLDPDALAKVAGTSGFADPAVGAVQIQVRMVNRGTNAIDGDAPAAATWFGRLLVSLQDLEFRTVIAAMQNARHMMHSAGMGGNGQFSRLSTLNRVARDAVTPWHSALLEDFEFGLHVLLAGGKTRYCDEAWVAQEALPDFARLVRQRTRWAQGGMQCMKYFTKVLRSRNLSSASAMEICYFLTVPWTQLIGTAVFAATSIMAFIAVLQVGGAAIGSVQAIPFAIMAAFAFGIAPIAVWGAVYKLKCCPEISWLRAGVLAVSHWLMSYAMLVAAWRAFGRLVRGRADWVKTARVAAVPAA